MDMIEKRKDSQAVIFLVFLCLIFFFDVLFLGNVFYAGDNLSINVPSKILLFRMLGEGHLPLWNPFIFSGTPFLADINLGLLSPFNVFYLFFTPLRALSLSIISAVLFAGVSMYWLGKSMKLSRFASVTAASVFMFSGSLMTHTMNTAILNTIVWLPLLFTSIKRLIETSKIKYALYSSILLTLSFYGGHVQYFYYMVLFSFFYIICQSILLKEKMKYVCFIFIPALFLSAIQLLPFLEYSPFSTRPLYDINYANGSTSLFSYIHLLLPNFFGVMKDGTSWGATADINGFVGVIPLLLATWAMFQNKSKKVLFFSVTVLVTFLLALGKYSPLYLFAFYFLPFFSRFRSPTSILIIYTFSLSILAGYAVDYLFQKPKVNAKSKQISILVFFVSSIVLLFSAIYVRLNMFSQFVSLIKMVNAIKKTTFFTRFLEYSSSRMQIIFHLWTDNIVILAFFLTLFFLFILIFRKQKCVTQIQKFIFLLLIVSELFIFGSNDYIVSTEKTLEIPKEIESFFSKSPGLFRILPMMDPGAKPLFGDAKYFESEAIKAITLHQPNTNVFQGEQSILGYASIVPTYYANYMLSNNNDPTGIAPPNPNMTKLDELGVRYIITAGRYEQEIKNSKKYQLVFKYIDLRINRAFHIFLNNQYYPRAYVIDEKNNYISSGQIASYKPNKIIVKALVFKSGRMVLSEMFYPGWEARVNGKRVNISKYKIFRSVPVEKGSNIIEFIYQPKSFIIGATLSVVNWVFVLGFLGFILIKDHQNIGKPLHIGKAKIKKNTK